MVADLDAVKAKYARVKNAERAEYVREQAEILRAEREAAAFAALDDLLSEV
jgi:membrane protein involved in colicin uptake